MENNCYMTLVTETKYIPCVKNCNFLMKHYKSKFPYIALVPKSRLDIYNQLVSASVQCVLIEMDKFGSDTRFCPLFADTINKFQIFNFTEYDKICFIDADILIKDNLDDIFNQLEQNESTCFFPSGRKNADGKPDGFAGELFIIRPDLTIYPRVLADKGLYTNDEEVLTAYFFNEENEIKQFPYFKIIHFSGIIKIWERCNTSFPQVQRFFIDGFTPTNDLISFVECIEYYQGYMNTWRNIMVKAFDLQPYVVLVQDAQDFKKAVKLEKSLKENGCHFEFVYIMKYQDKEVMNFLINKQKNFICSFQDLTYNNKTFVHALNLVTREMASVACKKFCFIYNLDMEITESLDYLFSDDLSYEKFQMAMCKYQNDLYLSAHCVDLSGGE